MVKLVYTYALGAYAARRAGSSPVPGTRKVLNSTLANKTIPALLVIFYFPYKPRKMPLKYQGTLLFLYQASIFCRSIIFV